VRGPRRFELREQHVEQPDAERNQCLEVELDGELSAGIGTASEIATGPVSIPSSTQNQLTPLCVSPF